LSRKQEKAPKKCSRQLNGTEVLEDMKAGVAVSSALAEAGY